MDCSKFWCFMCQRIIVLLQCCNIELFTDRLVSTSTSLALSLHSLVFFAWLPPAWSWNPVLFMTTQISSLHSSSVQSQSDLDPTPERNDCHFCISRESLSNDSQQRILVESNDQTNNKNSTNLNLEHYWSFLPTSCNDAWSFCFYSISFSIPRWFFWGLLSITLLVIVDFGHTATLSIHRNNLLHFNFVIIPAIRL